MTPMGVAVAQKNPLTPIGLRGPIGAQRASF
jgi:hypothetical protein